MNVVITGTASGLGRALAYRFHFTGHVVHGLDCHPGEDMWHTIPCDVSDAASVSHAVRSIDKVDVLINNAGVNGIDYLEDLGESTWDRVMDTNAKGIYLVTRGLLRKLIESKGTVLNIVSNAAHVPMTASLAYNASKGAADIMTKQMARELTRRHGITVFGIAPNRLKDTGMSRQIDSRVTSVRGWTQEEAHKYQLQSLLTGEETPPDAVADFAWWLLSDRARNKYLTGCVIPYGV